MTPLTSNPDRASRRGAPSIQRRLLLGAGVLLLLALLGQAVAGEYSRNKLWQQEFDARCLRSLASLKKRLPPVLFRRMVEQRRAGKEVAPDQVWPLDGEDGLNIDGLVYYRLVIEVDDTPYTLSSAKVAPELREERTVSAPPHTTIEAGIAEIDGAPLAVRRYTTSPAKQREWKREEFRRPGEPDRPGPGSRREEDRRERGPRRGGPARMEEYRERIAKRVPMMRELVVCFDASELAAQRQGYRLRALGITGMVVAVTSLLLLLLVRGSLRGVRKLCEEIDGLDANQLAPVSAEGLPQELLGVTETLNSAIARVDESYRREKAFSDNVAHELRTPIAVVCNEAELALRKERNIEAYQASLAHILDSAYLQQGLVEKLLHLSRLEGGKISISLSPVDLGEQARRNLDDAMTVAKRTDVLVETDLQPAPLETDLILLSQAVGNLLDNALAYASPETTVRVRTARVGDKGVFEVSNTATGLSAGDLSHLTQRFWRKDEARSELALHAGLGLTLVEQLVACLGGDLSFSLDGDTLSARIELPTT